MGDFDLLGALERLDRHETCLLLTHTNPDPDGIAAAHGLRHLIESKTNVSVTVGYSGTIGRAENRAMVRLLGLPMVPIMASDLKHYDAIGLVDTQPTAGNNVVPAGHPVELVVDHHDPRRSWDPPSSWVDIRSDAEATTLMVYGYLRRCNLPLPSELATAMLYGIVTDTAELSRCTSCQGDLEAYVRLLPAADLRILAAIRRPDLPLDHYRTLNAALDQTRVWGGKLVTLVLDHMPYPDLTAELADFLIRAEGIEVSLCTGRFKETLHLSVRTANPDQIASDLIMPLVDGLGSAGGHNDMAGGAIPLVEGMNPLLLGEQIAAALSAQLGFGTVASPLIPPLST